FPTPPVRAGIHDTIRHFSNPDRQGGIRYTIRHFSNPARRGGDTPRNSTHFDTIRTPTVSEGLHHAIRHYSTLLEPDRQGGDTPPNSTLFETPTRQPGYKKAKRTQFAHCFQQSLFSATRSRPTPAKPVAGNPPSNRHIYFGRNKLLLWSDRVVLVSPVRNPLMKGNERMDRGLP